MSGKRAAVTNWTRYVKTPVVFVAGCASDKSAVLRWGKRWPGATFHLFEPEPSNVAMLGRAFGRNPRITVNAMALSDQVGTMDFYANRIPMISSRLPLNRAMPDFPESWGHETVMQVPTMTVDAYCAENSIRGIGLFELDVQGGELAVLRGAADTLRRGGFDVLIVEVFYEAIYEDVPLEPMVSNYMARFGYRAVLNRPQSVGGRSADIIYARGQ